MFSMSERPRDEEAVDSGLASAAAEIGSIVSVEYPIVAVLAGQCLGDGDFPAVTVVVVDLVIVVGDAVHLVGPQVMRIGRPAARGLDPVGNRLAVGPIIMRRGRRDKRGGRAEGGERAAHHQCPAGRAGIPISTTSAKNR